jgi:hypothetical protein
MDPYLESPVLWPDVHQALIAEMQGQLNKCIRPAYVARAELRVYLSDEDDPGRRVIIPDTRIEYRGNGEQASFLSGSNSALAFSGPMSVPILTDDEIKEARLEIIEVKTKELVTVIELLSPTNKIRGSEGRKSFLQKRREILGSEVNWVEIDLLRAGVPSQPPRVPCDYGILIARGAAAYNGRFWPIRLRQPLPIIGIPLRTPDPDVPLDLGSVLQNAYDRAAYDLSVDYAAPPDPLLNQEDAKWADALLREKKLR